GGEEAARGFHPQHEVAELGLVVVEAVPLEADHVLLGDRLVTGLDHRWQVAEDVEPRLLVLQALDEVPLPDQFPIPLDLGRPRHPPSSLIVTKFIPLPSTRGSAPGLGKGDKVVAGMPLTPPTPPLPARPPVPPGEGG